MQEEVETSACDAVAGILFIFIFCIFGDLSPARSVFSSC